MERHRNDKIGEGDIVSDKRVANYFGKGTGNITDETIFEIVDHLSHGGIFVGNRGDQAVEMRLPRFPARMTQRAFVGDGVFASGTNLKIQNFRLRETIFAQPRAFFLARKTKNREKRIKYGVF
jgi:hypothetical protein